MIANGGEEFFTEVEGDVDYTYFAAAIAPTDAYSYFKFECTETAANLMQVSEVVLCSADAPAPAEPAPVEEVKEEETEAPTVEEKVLKKQWKKLQKQQAMLLKQLKTLFPTRQTLHPKL